MIETVTCSVKETISLGERLGLILKKGDTVCIFGDLGAGKTAFTGGIARALEIDEYITSPTFTIVNEYQGKLPLYHFDVYRLASSDDLWDIGFDEYLSGYGIVVIEWPERALDSLPKDYTRVEIAKIDNDTEKRRIQISIPDPKRMKSLENGMYA